jgi:3-hydroxyisobutyrate dehydrogenase
MRAAAVKDADVVITMLPAGKHVISVYDDLAPKAKKGALFIDSSTIDVQSARAAHAIAAKNGLLSVDAPVSGGTGGAAAGTLTFMAGGSAESFAKAEPILKPMAGRIVHCGDPGRRPGSKNLQQHDPRHFDDRRVGSLRARRKARPVASGAV